MALDLTKKYKILVYLGYPSGCIIEGNINYSRTVVDRLNSLPVELEHHVDGLLTRLSTLEGQLNTALSRAGVKKIDDIELNGLEMDSLRKEKRLVLGELASIFDLQVLSKGHSVNVNVCLG